MAVVLVRSDNITVWLGFGRPVYRCYPPGSAASWLQSDMLSANKSYILAWPDLVRGDASTAVLATNDAGVAEQLNMKIGIGEAGEITHRGGGH